MTCDGTDITREAERPRQSVETPSCATILFAASKKPAKCREEGAERFGSCCAAMAGDGYRHASPAFNSRALPPPPLLPANDDGMAKLISLDALFCTPLNPDAVPSLGSNLHNISPFSARLVVKYVFWQHVARFVAASERACCMEEGASARALPLFRAEGEGSEVVGGGTLDEGTNIDSEVCCV